ncbi:olfactomedin-4-like isoform X1 [Engystomops pustulosus]|uniref:olfactomedin-4-like isoform X1 n=1 Tax=Engystomops pustulosus TaxID=76066 RepID=UPI003AFAFD6D
MKTILLLWLSFGVCQAQTAISSPDDSPSKWKVMAGATDNQRVCHCSLAITDFTFPTERMELLETSNFNLSLRFQEEIDKIQGYQQKLDTYLENIKNLTTQVELWNKEGVSLGELDFEILKLEISEMESLVIGLKSSLKGSNDKVEALFTEVKNISIIANQLETHDKNNILRVRRQITSLQNRLDECRTSQSPVNVKYGTCEHGEIMNVSKPHIVQVNWRGTSYQIGGWGKESHFGSTSELYWVLVGDSSSYFSNVRLYKSYKDLRQYKTYKDQQTTSGRGSGLTLYNNSLYYHCHTRDVCKTNLETNKQDIMTYSNVATRFSYASSKNQDIDLEVDEYGLWALYSREDVLGNMVIGLVNATSLHVIRTWTTSVYKPSVTNAFMVCGVMYATRTLSTREEEIFYMYDTNTGEERHLRIPFEKILDNIHSLSYNPNDRKLYTYNDGFEIIYDLQFKPLTEGKS